MSRHLYVRACQLAHRRLEGAEPNKALNSGTTPLFLAQQYDNMAIVTILNDALSQQ